MKNIGKASQEGSAQAKSIMTMTSQVTDKTVPFSLKGLMFL